VNVAVTAVAAATVTAHVPVPEQPPPLQPENTLPAAGVAVKLRPRRRRTSARTSSRS